jgi:alpha/beta superfamily hydrolase
MTRFKPPTPEPLMIDGPAGGLEALLEVPDAADPRVAVVCHPHPLHGGTMQNKVVHMLARSLQMLGVRTVRFNYRGVGRSAGEYADGRGETEDAIAVIDWMLGRWPGAQMIAAGFSFGCGVVLRSAALRSFHRVVTVAPAADRLDAEGFSVPACPWLIVHGSQDELIPLAAVEKWGGGLSPRPRLEVITGADHFFHGRLVELREIVVDWIEHGDAAG